MIEARTRRPVAPDGVGKVGRDVDKDQTRPSWLAVRRALRIKL